MWSCGDGGVGGVEIYPMDCGVTPGTKREAFDVALEKCPNEAGFTAIGHQQTWGGVVTPQSAGKKTLPLFSVRSAGALSRPTSHIHRERTATVSIIHGPTAPCKQRQSVFISSLFHSVCLTFTHFYVWTVTPPPKKKQKNWISIRLTGHKCLNPVSDLLPQGRYILLLLQYMIKNIEYIPLLSK